VGITFPDEEEEELVLEGVLGVGFGSSRHYHGQMDLCPLFKQDMRQFRNNIGLRAQSGRLPSLLEARIMAACSKKDLKSIPLNANELRQSFSQKQSHI
jgi:hypothetical protein